MALVAPVVTISIDDPAVAGRIVRGSHHYGRNWEFDDDPDSPFEPKWWLGGVDYLRAMNAIAPRALVNYADMPDPQTTSYWNIEEGGIYWRRSRPAIIRPWVWFMDYRHMGNDAEASICSTKTFPPAVHIVALRFQPEDSEEEGFAPAMQIEFLGDGEGYVYGLHIPRPGEDVAVNDSVHKNPMLMRAAPGEWDERKTIGEYQGLGGSGYNLWPGAHVEHIRVEQVGDYLRIGLPGAPEGWMLPMHGDVLTRGPVRVRFSGGAGMFNIQPLSWMTSIWYRWMFTKANGWVLQWSPTEVEDADPAYTETYPFATPQKHLVLPDWVHGGPGVAEYPNVVATIPDGTSITVVEDDDGARGTRPRIQFVQEEGLESRPVLYRVHQINDPERTTVTRSATDVVPSRVTWHRSDEWRNSHFTAEFTSPSDAAALPAFGEAIFAIAADTGGAAPSPITRIIGYLDGSHAQREGSEFQGITTMEITARDHPAMRLDDRKFMRHMPTFENWTAEEAFLFGLKSCGVRDSYITVDAAVDDSYTFPENTPPWERAWSYPHDHGVIQAFDAMFGELMGLQWGWNESGYFLRERPTWTSGDSPDWTLDHDTSTVGDIVRVLRVERATSELRNYVAVWAGEDQQGGFWYDADSLDDPAADNYIGDDAWAMLGGAEAHSQASAMALNELLRLREYDVLIEFRTEKLDLEPDNFVPVQAGMTDYFADDSVFRLLDEDGDAKGGEEPSIEVTYTAGIVEYGP